MSGERGDGTLIRLSDERQCRFVLCMDALQRAVGVVTTRLDQANARLDETNTRLDQAVDVLTRLVQVVAAQNDRMNRNFERLNGRIDRLSKAIMAGRTADLKRFSRLERRIG